MNPVKGFFVMWIFFFLVVGVIGLVDVSDVSMTGNVPLTGILDEGQGEEFIFPEMNVSFFMEEETIYKLRDINFILDFKPNINSRTLVELDFIVTDSSGKIVYYDEDSLFISGETGIKMDLDRRKAQDVDLAEGDYVFSLRVSYLGEDKTFSQDFHVEEISEFLYSLKQLFDIKMEIDNPSFYDPEDLEVRVLFTSFGSEPTPVDLTFFIYDSNWNEVLRKTGSVVIETEGVLTETFPEFDNALPGKYRVVLRTVYNVDVEDYFEQEVTVKDKLDILPFIVAGLILIAGGIISYRTFFKKKK